MTKQKAIKSSDMPIVLSKAEVSTSQRQPKSKGSTSQAVVAQVKDKDIFPTLPSTRMSPKGIISFIKSNPSAQQLQAINEMGFSGLLELKTDILPGHLAYWLLSDFNPSDCSLMNRRLPINDEDIHLATGLPMGSIQIEQASTADRSKDFALHVKNFKKQFGTERITLKQLLEKLISQKEGGVEFKRNFVVYVVSCFLMGVKGDAISCRILKCLGDVSLINQMNWCFYTRSNLIESAIRWRRAKANEEQGGCTKVFKGPIMPLIFIYLDRVTFRLRNVPRVFPTLSSWTKERISERVNAEKNSGAFGSGRVDGPLVKTDLPADMDNENRGEKRRREITCIEELACAGKQLAVSYDSFLVSLNKAKAEMPYSDTVSQLSTLAESMVGNVRLSQQQQQEQQDNKTDHEDDTEEGIVRADGENKGDGSMSGVAPPASDDSYWDSVEFMDALTALERSLGWQVTNDVNRISKKRRPNDGSTSQEILTQPTPPNTAPQPTPPPPPPPPQPTSPPPPPQPTSPTPPPPRPTPPPPPPPQPTTTPPPPQPTTYTRRSAHTARPPHASPSPLSPPSFKLLQSQSQSQSQSQEDELPQGIQELITVDSSQSPQPIIMVDSVSQISSLPPPRESKRVRFATDVFRSPFLERTVTVGGDLNQLEKDVLEYAFGESSHDSDILFRSGRHTLSCGDLKNVVGSLQSQLRTLKTELVEKTDDVQRLQTELVDKTADVEYLQNLNETLIFREHRINNELVEARRELLNSLHMVLSNRTLIGIKRMGELNSKPFRVACASKFTGEESALKCAEVCSLWEENLKDPIWHPFKQSIIDGNVQEIVDESDTRLEELRKEWGEEVYKAVTSALMELNEYNPSGRYPVPEIWNLREERKVSLKEIVGYLIQQLKTHKHKRS